MAIIEKNINNWEKCYNAMKDAKARCKEDEAMRIQDFLGHVFVEGMGKAISIGLEKGVYFRENPFTYGFYMSNLHLPIDGVKQHMRKEIARLFYDGNAELAYVFKNTIEKKYDVILESVTVYDADNKLWSMLDDKSNMVGLVVPFSWPFFMVNYYKYARNRRQGHANFDIRVTFTKKTIRSITQPVAVGVPVAAMQIDP